MKYKIVESVNKKENINHPVDDDFTLSEELLDIKTEKINESLETEKQIDESYLWSGDVIAWNEDFVLTKTDENEYSVFSMRGGTEFIAKITANTDEEAKKMCIEFIYETPWRGAFRDGTLPEYVNDYMSGSMNESLEEDFEYSDYDKKLLVNRAKSIAKAISDLYNSNQVEAQGELPSENEIAKALLDSPKKIDMYAKFLTKIKGTKRAESIVEKLVKELMSFKKKLSMVKKPQPATESIERYSDVVPKENRKYWYFTTHGIGPGTLPKGVNILKVVEGQNDKGTLGDYLLLDAVLNTDELKYYGLRELSPKHGMGVDDFNESMDEDMRSEYVMDDSQMGEWNQICKAFAKKLGAKLVFVNETSCGLEFPDGSMKHVYIDEMVDYLGGMNESLLMEKAVPEEDRYENDLIKSIIRKRRDRANAKLTPEEQEVFNKYNLKTIPDKKQDRYWNKYRQRFENGPITTDNKTGVGRRVISSKDTWGVGAKDGKHDVNYVDMARKAPERIKREKETGIKGTYDKWGLGGSREEAYGWYPNATQQLRDKINSDAGKDNRTISLSLYNRKHAKDSIDATNKRFDDEKNRILKRNLERVTKEIADNESRRNSAKEYSQTRYDDATTEINKILDKHRKKKQESFHDVKRRSLNEADVPIQLNPDEMFNSSDSFDLKKAVKGRVDDQREKERQEAEAKRVAELKEKYKGIFSIIDEDKPSADVIEDLFEKLVPGSGKAEIVAGELARAVEKIRYRWWNDGDVCFIGYGIETCGNALCYITSFDGLDETVGNLLEKCSDKIKSAVDDAIVDSKTGFDVYSDSTSNKAYEEFLNGLCDAVVSWMRENPDKCVEESNDMFSDDYSDDSWIKDYEPRKEIEVSDWNFNNELTNYLSEYGEEIGYTFDDALEEIEESIDWGWGIDAVLENNYRDCLIYSVAIEDAQDFFINFNSWCDNKYNELVSEYGEYPGEEDEDYDDEENEDEEE